MSPSLSCEGLTRESCKIRTRVRFKYTAALEYCRSWKCYATYKPQF